MDAGRLTQGRVWDTRRSAGDGEGRRERGGGVRSASLGCRRARADRRWRLLCGAGPFLAESRRAGWAGRRARGSRRSSRGSAKSIFVDLQFGRAEPRVNESDGSARRARPRPLRCRSVGGAAHRARGRHERALLRMRAHAETTEAACSRSGFSTAFGPNTRVRASSARACGRPVCVCVHARARACVRSFVRVCVCDVFAAVTPQLIAMLSRCLMSLQTSVTGRKR